MGFNWVSILLCMGVSLQGLYLSIQTEQSFELRLLQEDGSKVYLMFLAFFLLMLSFWVLYLNKFWMISFLEIISFCRYLISFSSLHVIVLYGRVLYWFLLSEFSLSMILFCTKLHILVFMACSRTSLIYCMGCQSGWKYLENPVSSGFVSLETKELIWSSTVGEWVGFKGGLSGLRKFLATINPSKMLFVSPQKFFSFSTYLSFFFSFSTYLRFCLDFLVI